MTTRTPPRCIPATAAGGVTPARGAVANEAVCGSCCAAQPRVLSTAAALRRGAPLAGKRGCGSSSACEAAPLHPQAASLRAQSSALASAPWFAPARSAHARRGAPAHGGPASTRSGRWRSGGSCTSVPTEALNAFVSARRIADRVSPAARASAPFVPGQARYAGGAVGAVRR